MSFVECPSFSTDKRLLRDDKTVEQVAKTMDLQAGSLLLSLFFLFASIVAVIANNLAHAKNSHSDYVLRALTVACLALSIFFISFWKSRSLHIEVV